MGELRRVPIAAIDVPPARIRHEMGSIEDLAYSVGSVGLLHPVHVYRVRTRYRLIAGERRLQAARLLGWTEIEAIVREPSDNHLLLELVENTQRKWLTDLEEADAFIRLVRDMGHEAKEVAAQAGRSEAYVSKRMRVFEDACLREAVAEKRLSVSIAEEFLGAPPADRPALVAQAVAEGWDGRRAREAARADVEPAPALPADDPTTALLADDGPRMRPVIHNMLHQVEAREAESQPDESETPSDRRPSDLARQVRALDAILRDLRPFELTPADERALASLLQTLLKLARAHAGAGRAGLVFPSLEQAQRHAARRR